MEMEKGIFSIMELMRIREQKSKLSDRETELVQARINDYSLIPRVKDLYFRFLSDTGRKYNRKILLFVLLFLFSPSVLAGGRLSKGFRRELSKIFPDIRPCVISNDISDLFFQYQHYKDFREEAKASYKSIIEGLTV